jgi:hypothetical protein
MLWIMINYDRILGIGEDSVASDSDPVGHFEIGVRHRACVCSCDFIVGGALMGPTQTMLEKVRET